ncbi:membrane dipeptidase-domain-containing protein [Rhypophila decipiens]|uniref:Dipeptidase n=1 Tax=Rhypophila decipiens TaxID=261697 RepID=A0AAN6YKB1_9PEZI|nr:membrane dipeptidase-domain-containing protein [Rhypophila decipiens]
MKETVNQERGRYTSVNGDDENLSAPIVDETTKAAINNRRARSFRLCALFSVLILSLLFLRPASQYCASKFLDKDSSSAKPESIDERVKQILTETPLIDGHNDLPILLRFAFNNHIYNESFKKPFEEGGLMYHVDLPRLQAGMNGGAFWSVFWPCPEKGQDYTDGNYASTVQATYQQIDLVSRLKAAYPKDFSPSPVDSSNALSAFKKGQLISPLGVEGLHQIGNSAANLRNYHALGVRYVTLTHNCGNKYADAALWENPFRKAPAQWGGVSPDGQALIHEMNRIGMMVDLSHTSVDTMVDVLGGSGKKWKSSKAPVIFSHSSAYSICPHPRNVPDHVLELVKKTNSLVMVNFSPDFVSCVANPDREDGIPDFYPANSTLEHVVTHILHIGNLIGFDHVGFGSDFDGIQSTPKGLDDVSFYPALVAEMLKRGVSDEDAAKVAGANVLRVWKDVEEVAAELQAAGTPVLEDDLPKMWDGESNSWGQMLQSHEI